MALREISNDLFFTSVKNIIYSGNSVELRIKGTSMYPTLLDGKHKVVLVPYQKQYLKVGILALFVYNKKHILHRLISINGNCLIFQGDNQPNVREEVKEEDIIAIVEFIITPTGKVLDCKKQCLFAKNRFWRTMRKYYSIYLTKARSYFINTFISRH